MCTGTWGGYLNPDSRSRVGLFGEIDQQLALVLCGDCGAPRDRRGERFYTDYCSPLLSTELKENYIPHAVAVYH